MKCSTCKWWDSAGLNLPPHPEVGFLWIYKPCLNPLTMQVGYTNDPSESPTNGAGPIYSNDDIFLYVFGPDFGCVNWEPLNDSRVIIQTT